MKKIKTLFVIDRDTNRATETVTPGAEWVLKGEGRATIKFDGSSCVFLNGRLHKRFDRKLKKGFSKKARAMGDSFVPEAHMFNELPEGAIPCEEKPAAHSLHFPHWVPVGEGPEDALHREALENTLSLIEGKTYELVGPKVNGNPYGLTRCELWEHGNTEIEVVDYSFDALKALLEGMDAEGIVWHRGNGDMIKLRRKDFGFFWNKEDPRDR